MEPQVLLDLMFIYARYSRQTSGKESDLDSSTIHLQTLQASVYQGQR
jgi:hypothetical protein